MQRAVDKPATDDAASTRNYQAVTRVSLPTRDEPAGVSLRWAAVYTHPQAERWAQQTLTGRGYTTWLPLVPIRRRDRVLRTLWHTVQAPAFPRYLFVRHRPGSPTHPVAYGDGIAGLVRMDGQPAYASDMALEAVRKALEAGEGVGRPPDTGFAPGTPLRWSAGPLKGFDAIALGADGDGRTRISVVFLGGLQEITALNHQLIPRD